MKQWFQINHPAMFLDAHFRARLSVPKISDSKAFAFLFVSDSLKALLKRNIKDVLRSVVSNSQLVKTKKRH